MTGGRLAGGGMTPRKWADRLVAGLDAATRDGLRTAPAQTIRDRLGLSVAARHDFGERGQGGWCDGLSIIDKGVVMYAPTRNSRRENFTLDHEVGHWLIENDTDETTIDWVADLPEPGKVIEQVCNLVAAGLLLPDTQVRAILATTGPGGHAVSLLHEQSEASREVCTIAVAQRMPCDGFVAVIDLNGPVVTFAARAHEGRPYPRRGEPVPTGHPVLRLADNQTAATESWWPRPDGNPHRYYQHATRQGHWAYLAAADNDLWNAAAYHAPSNDPPAADLPQWHIACPCGYTGTARGYPCNTCKLIPCPKCHECDCDRKERQPRNFCNHCMSHVPLTQLDANGLCPGCQ